MLGFVYMWTNNINNKKYIGAHVGNINDGYLGSGKYFKNAIKKYGIENFNRTILYIEEDSIDNIFKKEFELINQFNAIGSDSFYNVVNKTPDMHRYVEGKFYAKDCFTHKGKKYYNNGIIDSRFYPNEQPEGWVLGRIKTNLPDPKKGTKWYNNGIVHKRFYPNEQPEGWVLGTLKERLFGEKNHFYGKKHTKETIEKIKSKSKPKYGNDNPSTRIDIRQKISRAKIGIPNLKLREYHKKRKGII